MAKTIDGRDKQLKEIFSKEYDFVIPAYQRPYAWTDIQAGELFDDLYSFCQNGNSEGDYFLGSIVLIKEEKVPLSQVVDGQQRLTTLTILLAVVASMMTGKTRDACWSYIREEGNEIEEIKPKPRLRLRERDAEFFRRYVQELKIDELLDPEKVKVTTEVQRHIRDNAALFKSRLKTHFGGDSQSLVNFMKFLMQHCYLVAVSTPNKQSAFRVFSVLNNRGLDLLPIDIIKADLIGKIKDDEQENYTQAWEEIEEETGRDDLNSLFGHIRTMYAKAKAKKTLMDEFSEFVVPNIGTPENFITNILRPYADAYRIIVRKDYQSAEDATKINKLLGWLGRVNNSDWMPPAILYLARHNSDSDVLLFLSKLERLVAYMHICGWYVNDRIERFAALTKEIEDEIHLSSIELTEEEKEEFVNTLDGNIYGMSALRRNYVVLRLDSFVGDGAASYTPATLTIEHVLPQTPKEGGQWLDWWPDEELRKCWTHRIANLVPLPRQKNSEAQNFEFDMKKDKYFMSRKHGTTSYALTSQVLQAKEWKPENLVARQNDLLQSFKQGWNL